MSRVKSLLALLLTILTPACSFASSTCIAASGGFGNGGTTFIAPGFSLPSEGKCASWVGFAKTASTVVVTTYGTGCLSSDGKVLTVAVSSADPDWFGMGNIGSDYIELTRSGTGKPFNTGFDKGAFGGDAQEITCTSSLLNLPSSHA